MHVPQPPPIRVVIADGEGNEDVVIKVDVFSASVLVLSRCYPTRQIKDLCLPTASRIVEIPDRYQVSDEGGGVSRSNMSRIWSYLFTTADPGVQEATVGDGDSSDFDTGSPLAGLGYGLPISRAYARYFGGDLNLMSMEGYGTDAFVHCSRLGTHDEPLP